MGLSKIRNDSPETEKHGDIRKKSNSIQLGIFKSRGITLPTNVHLIKAMVFPVVVHGCEKSSKLSAEELMLLNCDVGEDSCESLGLQGD